MRSSIGVATLAALLVGCSGSAYHHHGGRGGGVPVAPGIPVYRILPNASSQITTGTRPGYAITASTGGSYRLVWTGDGDVSGAYREFWGSVYTQGRFRSINPGCGGYCVPEADAYISQPVPTNGGERVDFDTLAGSRIDGFDFLIDTEPVYFDLSIEGGHYPNLVYFPATDNFGAVSNVDTIPFGLTTR